MNNEKYCALFSRTTLAYVLSHLCRTAQHTHSHTFEWEILSSMKRRQTCCRQQTTSHLRAQVSRIWISNLFDDGTTMKCLVWDSDSYLNEKCVHRLDNGHFKTLLSCTVCPLVYNSLVSVSIFISSNWTNNTSVKQKFRNHFTFWLRPVDTCTALWGSGRSSTNFSLLLLDIFCELRSNGIPFISPSACVPHNEWIHWGRRACADCKWKEKLIFCQRCHYHHQLSLLARLRIGWASSIRSTRKAKKKKRNKLMLAQVPFDYGIRDRGEACH